MKCLMFSTKFYLFYTRHIIRRFVVQRLCGHIAREDVRLNFLFQFFNILKYVKYVFQNIGSMHRLPGAKTFLSDKIISVLVCSLVNI
jgi:hypothetical protein